MIRLAAESGPQKTETQDSLFGPEEVTRSLIAEKAEVSDYIRKQLAGEKKLFGLVGSEAVAGKLGERGNVIQAGANQAVVATQAAQALAIYDKLSARVSGPVADALATAATDLAGGKDATKPSKPPTSESDKPSPSQIQSPEFHREMCDELKDWVAKGHCKLARGNTILPKVVSNLPPQPTVN